MEVKVCERSPSCFGSRLVRASNQHLCLAHCLVRLNNSIKSRLKSIWIPEQAMAEEHAVVEQALVQEHTVIKQAMAQEHRMTEQSLA
eukprot:1160590-Pelagomonas_calceolata.AAC.2